MNEKNEESTKEESPKEDSLNNVEQEKYKMRRMIFSILGISIFVLIMIIITIIIFPYVKNLNDQEYRQEFINYIRSFGFFGSLFVILCFMLQVLLAVIPSEPFELIAGAMYGPWLGLIIASIGLALGAALVYFLVKLFGKGFVKSIIDIDNPKFKILNDTTRSKVIMFSLLITPGLPKDFLAFLVPFTKIKLSSFLILNFIARIPSVITSTIFAASLINGEYIVTIVVSVISLVIGILCMIFNKQITNFICKNKNS